MIQPITSARKSRREIAPFWHDLSGFVLIAAGSLALGLLVNGGRSSPLPLVYASPKDRLTEAVVQMSAKLPAAGSQGLPTDKWQPIALDEFQDLVSTSKSVSIDARAKAFYLMGHVPGAINLPREDFEESYAGVRQSLETKKELLIVVYCSEADCKDSELVADALSHLGYRHVFVFKEGWEEWRRAGLPQEAGD